MKTALFTYTDKTGDDINFVLQVAQENFEPQQIIKLKEVGLTIPKLYETLTVDFNPRIHHIKPTITFLNYKEQDGKHSKYINLLNSLEEDCNMAISGEWDCSSNEGKEGFNSMIENIQEIRDYLKTI